MKHALAILALIGLSSCSMGASVPVAEKAVVKFHAMLDRGEFQQIYDQSGSALKSTATGPQLVALLSAVHRKLGTTRQAVRQGWNEQYNGNGHTLTLGYDTAYERGKAAETFVFQVADKDVSLAGYHINSDALILN
jgi:outer membrane phospholipase A